MQSILNNKGEKDCKNIVITLSKIGDEYSYSGDTYSERTKIKIPLEDTTRRDKKVISNDSEAKITKDDSTKIKINKNFTNGVIYTSNNNNYSNTNHNEELSEEEPVDEIPLLNKQLEACSKQQIIIPTCSQWFSFDKIDEIEMKNLPEFFCGRYPSKTPETYKEYRNYIINLYRENPNSYLTSTGIFNF